MPDGMGFLLRPVRHGFAALADLDRVGLDLTHFSEANEYLDAEEENRLRVAEWAARRR